MIKISLCLLSAVHYVFPELITKRVDPAKASLWYIIVWSVSPRLGHISAVTRLTAQSDDKAGSLRFVSI